MPLPGRKKEVFNIPKREVSALLWGARNLGDKSFAFAFDALALMYVLGLRIGEARLLRYEHKGTIDSSGLIRSVRVPTLKRTKRAGAEDGKALPPPPLIEVPVLAHFDWVRTAFDHTTRKGRASVSKYLFPSPRDPTQPMSVRMMHKAFAFAARRGGVMPGATPHSLRHTASTEIYRFVREVLDESEEVSLIACRRFLRHAKGKVWTGRGSDQFATTRIYVHVNDDKFKGLNDWMPLIRGRALVLPTPAPTVRAIGLGLA